MPTRETIADDILLGSRPIQKTRPIPSCNQPLHSLREEQPRHCRGQQQRPNRKGRVLPTCPNRFTNGQSPQLMPKVDNQRHHQNQKRLNPAQPRRGDQPKNRVQPIPVKVDMNRPKQRLVELPQRIHQASLLALQEQVIQSKHISRNRTRPMSLARHFQRIVPRRKCRLAK